ncbi:hypothetical protein BJ875DRAFT_457034 [Amylocarpus encephaloides]|uniref:DUF1279 domain-containing protein n=1 Tax=Amylocarpus encephaloides TaxID=45428 RepID=A0A9P7YLV3_9HELO|nr:hypothetical protein BJ875DRAFT_457034 [Amylocarpus encephaloides]
MLRTTIPLAGARGAPGLPQLMRPFFRAHLSSSIPVQSLARRTIATAHTSPLPKNNPGMGWVFSSSYSRANPLNWQTIPQRLRSSIRSLHISRRRRSGKATSPNPTPNPNSPKGVNAEGDPTTLGGRLKKLSREYGWSVVGVYFVLSVLDFPFCFFLVRYLGTDRIGGWEEAFISAAKRIIPESVKETWTNWRSAMKKGEQDATGGDIVNETVEMASWGVEEAQARNKRDASLATQLALAYAIHKSFIFLRIPLTAAVTPKVVKILRGWGWDIGKRTTKEAKAIKRARHSRPKARRP